MKAASKKYLHVIIAIIIGIVLLNVVPPVNGLTEVGVRVIAVFIPILYLWLTIGTDWTSWLAMALIFMTGVLDPGDVYAGVLGSALIITVIGMMAFSFALVETGVIDTIVKWAITREFIRNRPYGFMAILFIVCGILSVFLDVGAVVLVFIPVIQIVCEEIGYKKGDKFYTALMLGLFWITNACNGGSPFGHALPLIMMNSASAAGYDITYAQWMRVGIPAAILISAVAIIFICLIWRPEASKFGDYDLDAHRAEVQPLTKRGIIALITLIAVVVYWLVPTILPNLLPARVMATYNTWGSTLPVVIGIALLCVLSVKGEPVADFKKITSNSTMSILLFIGAVSVLGTAISSDATGISTFLGNVLAPVTSHMSLYALIIVAFLFCVILTNFISNTVSMLLFFSIVVPIAVSSGGNPITIIVLLCVMACFASLVPSAAATAPFFFGNDNITVRNALKPNIVMIIFAWACIAFIIYPIFHG